MNSRKQLTVFAVLLVVYALCALFTYTFFTEQLTATTGIPSVRDGLPAARPRDGRRGQCAALDRHRDLIGGMIGETTLAMLYVPLLFYLFDLSRVLLVAPLLAAVRAWLAAPVSGRAARPLAVVLIALTVCALVWRPGFDPQRLAMGTSRIHQVTPYTFSGPRRFHTERMVNRNLIHQEDGPLDSVAVLEVPAWDLPLPRPLEIYINGKSDSNTMSDRETLRLSAHIPMLLAARDRRALIIGQGTGVTLGELTLWPELTRIDRVEVSPSVLRTLPLFHAHTHDATHDRRLRVHVQDARFFPRRNQNRRSIGRQTCHTNCSGEEIPELPQ